MWMGGWVPPGYLVRDRKLVVNEPEAKVIRAVFEGFAKLRSGTKLIQKLAADRMRNKFGKPFDKGQIYKLLNNRVYIGDAVHKGTAYPGEHKPIISRQLWDAVHGILKESPRRRAAATRAQTPALLKGLIFGPTGAALTPSHTRRRGRLYRYYVSTLILKGGPDACPLRRVPAGDIEKAVIGQIRLLVRTPEILVATWRAARKAEPGIKETDVRSCLHSFDGLWNELFPAEQARIVQLLVERVDVRMTEISIQLRTGGMATLIAELRSGDLGTEAA
jgi:site-specific DNA recombinase